MSLRLLASAPVVAAAALALGGCGEDPGGATPASELGGTFEAPAQGISFTTPVGWQVRRGTAPLVAVVRTGQATISVWRYPREERVPQRPDELEAARAALLAEAHRRDPTYDAVRSASTRVADRPAVQIRARRTVRGTREIVRSTHIFHAGAEIVVDASTAPGSFRALDAETFRPLLLTLRVVRPAGEA